MSAEFGMRIAELRASDQQLDCARAIPHSAFHIPHLRSGMTLIELLIVIVILATLTAAALPVLTPSTNERRIRESSRELNTYITQAQAKAIATQRPYGIALKRLSSETGNVDARGVCLEVFMVEQPAPYAGFDVNSRARVALNVAPAGGIPPVRGFPFPTVLIDFVSRTSSDANLSDGLPPGWDADLVPPALLRPGDVVEINGNRYELQASSNNKVMPVAGGFYAGYKTGDTHGRFIVGRPIIDTGQVLRPVTDSTGLSADPVSQLRLGSGWILAAAQGTASQPPVPPYWTEPSPYKVLRQPATTSAAPFQLPDGTAIDLEASGVVGQVPFHYSDGNNNTNLLFETPTDTPIYIMFSPEGSIERVQLERMQAVNGELQFLTSVTTPTANVSLLVGRRENIPADTSLDFSSTNQTQLEETKSKINWLNLESRWVTIGAQTGSVVTTEIAYVNPASVFATDYDGDGDVDGLDARIGQILTSQEYAREMKRLGGR